MMDDESTDDKKIGLTSGRGAQEVNRDETGEADGMNLEVVKQQLMCWSKYIPLFVCKVRIDVTERLIKASAIVGVDENLF